MKIELASPCSESWDQMAGDERRRFCGKCKLNVYNLSEMTEPEVKALFWKNEGRVCGRFFQRPDGTVLTRDCPIGRFRRNVRRLAALAGVLLAAATAYVIFGEGESADEFRGWVMARLRPETPTPTPTLMPPGGLRMGDFSVPPGNQP